MADKSLNMYQNFKMSPCTPWRHKEWRYSSTHS